ncbi:MAG: site-specific DNA-methyltransferase [Planctomycetia bacterium]|nr:MAG: site-specific DNA-methyltransferase [Planctomycetia bacterium]RIK69785.1 MAG: site-specific DNA-methyltransferase [Planctomycetota bacterium]
MTTATVIPRSRSTLKTSKKTAADYLNRVFEGDCLEIMPDLPSESVDMVLCDLPYGTTQNVWDSVIPLDRLWSQYERLIKPRGVIALMGQGLFTARLMLSNPRLFRYKIAWVKSKPTNFLNAKKQPLRKHEDICIFYKNQPTYNPQMSVGEPYNKGFRKDQFTGSYGEFKPVVVKSNGERYPTDVVYFKTAESEGTVLHPTQKPVALGRYLIRTFTNPGDVVLDNACGVGSFLVAAAVEGRHYIGIERNREVLLHRRYPVDYIEICKQRLASVIAERRARLF